MTNSGKIFVILDPTAERQIALERAVQLGIDTQSSLHVFCCTHLDEVALGEFASRRDGKHHEMERLEAWLDKTLAPYENEGLTIEKEIWWNEKWAESACHAAARCGASMIVKSSFSHSKLGRVTRKTSDLTLLRNSSCPVLLAKSSEPWMNKRVLAAVALDQVDEEHERLNNIITTEARRLADMTGFELHVLAAHQEHPDIALVLNMLCDDEEVSRQAYAAQRFGIPEEQMHLVQGNARLVIIDKAYELKADVVVIGSSARKGIKAALIGNTAEKVLDELNTDLLVVN